MKTKKCTKCNRNKNISEFRKDSQKRDGLYSSCKICSRKASKINRSKPENKKKISEQGKIYREQNKNILKKKQKEYAIKNRNKKLKYLKQYRESHKKEMAEKKKEWAENNRERIKHNHKEWRNKNPEVCARYCRNRRAKKEEVNENYTEKDWNITLIGFNYKCFNCGSADNLHKDHNYPLSMGFALSILNAVPLCETCNKSKGPKLPIIFYGEKKCKQLNKKLKKLALLHSK